MRKKIVRCVTAFSLLLLGGLDVSIQPLDLSTTTAAYAWGHKGDRGGNPGGGTGGGNGGNPEQPGPGPVSVPEPSLLALAVAGAGGYGVYRLIRNRNKK